MILNCVAIDDEPIALQIITQYCKRLDNLKITTFSDADMGLEYIRNEKVDIIFLDIEMNETNGVDFATNLPKDICVIFTSAYMQYAIEGFNLDAVDFLHKPFSFERFAASVEKARRRMGYGVSNGSSDGDYVIVKADYCNERVLLSDIVYIEAMENYSKIYRRSSDTIVAHHSLKNLNEQLPTGKFLRIHKSYIAPVESIKNFNRQYVNLADGTRLPVGRQFIADLFRTLHPNYAQ